MEFLRNDKYPFAIANIDRAVVGEKAFLECKVTNSFIQKRMWQMASANSLSDTSESLYGSYWS